MKEAAERKFLQVEIEENIRITETEEIIEAELISSVEESTQILKTQNEVTGNKLWMCSLLYFLYCPFN